MMKRFRTSWLLLLLFLLPARVEGVIASWWVRIGGAAPGLGSDTKFHRLEQPPAASVFFHPGDELWDLKPALDCYDIPSSKPGDPPAGNAWRGQWLVWNATTRRLVVSGSWQDVLAVSQVGKLNRWPRQISCRVERVTGPPQEEESSSLLVAVPEFLPMQADNGDLSFGCSVSRCSFTSAECDFSVTWRSGVSNREEWRISSVAYLKPGERTLIARHRAEPDPWSLYLTVQRADDDGAPIGETRRMEQDGRAVEWPPAERMSFYLLNTRVDATRSVRFYDAPSDPLREQIDKDFTDRIEVPAELAQWITGRLIDVTKIFQDRGLDKSSGGSFQVYYDPLIQDYIVIADEETQVMFEACAFPIYEIFNHQSVWTETNADGGGWGILCGSGEKAVIDRGEVSDEDDAASVVFQMEPLIASSGKLLDFSLQVALAPEKFLRTNLVMMDRQTLTAGKIQSTDGKEIPVEVTARVMEVGQ